METSLFLWSWRGNESVQHLFLECEHSKRIWRASSLGFNFDVGALVSFNSWIIDFWVFVVYRVWIVASSVTLAVLFVFLNFFAISCNFPTSTLCLCWCLLFGLFRKSKWLSLLTCYCLGYWVLVICRLFVDTNHQLVQSLLNKKMEVRLSKVMFCSSCLLYS